MFYAENILSQLFSRMFSFFHYRKKFKCNKLIMESILNSQYWCFCHVYSSSKTFLVVGLGFNKIFPVYFMLTMKNIFVLEIQVVWTFKYMGVLYSFSESEWGGQLWRTRYG